jgi:hypothetical protein
MSFEMVRLASCLVECTSSIISTLIGRHFLERRAHIFEKSKFSPVQNKRKNRKNLRKKDKKKKKIRKRLKVKKERKKNKEKIK